MWLSWSCRLTGLLIKSNCRLVSANKINSIAFIFLLLNILMKADGLPGIVFAVCGWAIAWKTIHRMIGCWWIKKLDGVTLQFLLSLKCCIVNRWILPQRASLNKAWMLGFVHTPTTCGFNRSNPLPWTIPMVSRLGARVVRQIKRERRSAGMFWVDLRAQTMSGLKRANQAPYCSSLLRIPSRSHPGLPVG